MREPGAMRGRKAEKRAAIAVFLFLASPLFAATRWFRSNASGLPLEEVTRSLAMRAAYAVSIEEIGQDRVPQVILSHLEDEFTREFRILWRNGEESRRLWVFRDGTGRARLSAAFNSDPLEWPPEQAAGGAEAGPSAEEEKTFNFGGFIERYDPEGIIVAEHRFDKDRTERITRFYYNGAVLIRAETSIRRPGAAPEPYCTDRYFYNRAQGLRAVDRKYLSAADRTGSQDVRFTHRLDQAASAITFERPQNAASLGYHEGPPVEAGETVLYSTDSHGRVLSETHKNSEEEITSETVNTWVDNRLAAVEIRSGDDVRRTEYDYDAAGDRLEERKYRNGVLERRLRSEGDREIEELYMNGQAILRAVWENGRKISEERIRGAAQ